MGCDIHMYSETKIDGKWVCDQAQSFSEEVLKDPNGRSYMDSQMDSLDIWRNYALFGYLAQVRQDWDEGFEPRGVPDDCSVAVQCMINQWDSDGHSHSWLMVPEIKVKAVEMLVDPSTHLDRVREGLMEILSKLPESNNPEEQRIVFWFDN
jgi:hypothetical protein